MGLVSKDAIEEVILRSSSHPVSDETVSDVLVHSMIITLFYWVLKYT